jgi:hypothetical protein
METVQFLRQTQLMLVAHSSTTQFASSAQLDTTSILTRTVLKPILYVKATIRQMDLV